MPLYTYVVSYKGSIYVNQARRSNFQGFGDWATQLPKGALPPQLAKQMFQDMYGGFEQVPNSSRTWRKTVTVGDTEMAIIAIQTTG